LLLILTLTAACKPENASKKKIDGPAKAKEEADPKKDAKEAVAKEDDGKAREIKVIKRFSGLATPVSYKGPPPDGEKVVTRELVVKTEADWKVLLGMVPSKLPRKGSDSTTNSDPLLKTPMPDFTKHMVIVTARVNSIFAKPAIKKLVVEKGVLTVSVLKEKAVPEQHPIDWGSYNAVIIEKFDGQVKFVWTEAK
ncbi:MAG: hypothetical protein P1V97_12370, partial [Planctomycetota bacterium]|nr:hypothetical protein [Planctomycetota bacterium]